MTNGTLWLRRLKEHSTNHLPVMSYKLLRPKSAVKQHYDDLDGCAADSRQIVERVWNLLDIENIAQDGH